MVIGCIGGSDAIFSKHHRRTVLKFKSSIYYFSHHFVSINIRMGETIEINGRESQYSTLFVDQSVVVAVGGGCIVYMCYVVMW